MTRYRVSWSGVARRTFAVERPADVLYALWLRHREEVAHGVIELDVGGEVTFPVSLEDTVEAADMHGAVADFRSRHGGHDIGGDVLVEEVRP